MRQFLNYRNELARIRGTKPKWMSKEIFKYRKKFKFKEKL
jgi:hypothetical protein